MALIKDEVKPLILWGKQQRRYLFELLVCMTLAGSAMATPRELPYPLAGNPGNIFLTGEVVRVPLPVGDTAHWIAIDYDRKTVAEGNSTDGTALLGTLGVGYYEVHRVGSSSITSIGVLAPLQALTPTTSPISVDVAAAWFCPEEQLDALASLCALAGINRVRDRLNWGAMEPKPQEFSGPTIYDTTARVQAAHGLQVLQVNHLSPLWANPAPNQMPDDLRDAYRFYRSMAERWKGQITAFEPWNEPDLPLFGGKTGAEIAAFQKACYWGLKAGNPRVTVCSPPLALAQSSLLDDENANELWAYCDTYNFHHYTSVDAYPSLYAAHRTAAHGKPLWVSECNVPVNWSGDPQAQEPNLAELHLQTERVAAVYAGSLQEGAAATFYFLLQHYVEGQIQYGLLHRDLSPRPAYLALAAVGRLLADARPQGRLQHPRITGHLFTALPDGKPRTVLVAWTKDTPEALALPATPVAIFDLLGRPCTIRGTTVTVTHAPVFILMPQGSERLLPITAPPPVSTVSKASRTPIVLQVIWPTAVRRLQRSAAELLPGQSLTAPIYAYNFGTSTVKVTLTITAPNGWIVQAPKVLRLAPRVRVALPVTVQCPLTAQGINTVTLVGHVPQGETRLSLRLCIPQICQKVLSMAGCADPAHWEAMCSSNSTVALASVQGGVQVTAHLGTGDRWVYPDYMLPNNEQLHEGSSGLQLTLTPLTGKATSYHVLFVKRNGSVYVADLADNPKLGSPLRLSVLLADAQYGAFSPPDPDGKLELGDVQAIRIGANTQEEDVAFRINEVDWVR